MKKIFIIIITILSIVIFGIFLFIYQSSVYYTAQELSIQEISSSIDKDNDGIDDYHDFVLSARQYIQTNPTYKSAYYAGGYPDDGCGVCTDVIIQAFLGSGYDIKTSIDQDIELNQNQYSIEKQDKNIDFRRVRNLNIYFSRFAETLTIETNNPEDWQPGDIVIYEKHIALCSDRRNNHGFPFIIHHDFLGAREKNELTNSKIIAHYRWKENFS